MALTSKVAKAASDAIKKASGSKKTITAEKELTTPKDFKQSLSDRVAARVAEDKKKMEGMTYEYKEGQNVFTEDSAKRNRPPMKILRKTIVKRNGKEEPGYFVRLEEGEDWQEFSIPQSAVKGNVEYKKGGLVKKKQVSKKPVTVSKKPTPKKKK